MKVPSTKELSLPVQRAQFLTDSDQSIKTMESTMHAGANACIVHLQVFTNSSS